MNKHQEHVDNEIGNAGCGGVLYDRSIRPYNEDIHWNAEKLADLFDLHRKGDPENVVTIVETGVGTGRLAEVFFEILKRRGCCNSVRYLGYDYSRSQLDRAEEVLEPYSEFVSLEKSDVLSDNFFSALEADIITNSAFLGYVPPTRLEAFLYRSIHCLVGKTETHVKPKSLALFHPCDSEHMKEFILFAEKILSERFEVEAPQRFRIRHHHNLPNNTIERIVEEKLLGKHFQTKLEKKIIPVTISNAKEWMKFWAGGYQSQLSQNKLEEFNTMLSQYVNEYQQSGGGVLPHKRRASIFTVM